MKLVITESQAEKLTEQLRSKVTTAGAKALTKGIKTDAGRSTANYIGDVGTKPGSTNMVGMAPDMMDAFGDIDIEKDAPNLAKFLSGLKNIDKNLLGSKTKPTDKTAMNVDIPIKKLGMTMMHPLGHQSHVSSGFGPRDVKVGSKNHKGIDIDAPSGSPIYAPLSGIVTKSLDTTPDPCGGHIRINHGKLQTKYCHLSRMIVHKGQRVKKGDLIGYTGGGEDDPHPGRSTGPHLHYEILTANGDALAPITIQPNLA